MADQKLREMIDALTEDTSPDLQADYALTNDTSASLQKKVKPWRFARGAKGSDVASASTVNLDTATGDLVDVTGTTTITAITLSEGRHATVRFTGILTLTHGASLVLLGGANIVTAAGDFAIFRGYATGVVRCVAYHRAAVTPDPQDFRQKIFQALGSAIVAQNFDIANTTATLTMGDGIVRFFPIWLPKPQTLTGVKWYQNTAGNYTGDNNNKVGLYTYSGGTLTKVAESTNDANLWKATGGTFGSKAFSSTYAAGAGLYFIAILYNQSSQTTAPVINKQPDQPVNTLAVDFTNSAKLASKLTGQTDLPSSQAMSGLTAETDTPWLALY